MTWDAGDGSKDLSHSTVPIKVVAFAVVAFIFLVNHFILCCVCCGYRRRSVSPSTSGAAAATVTNETSNSILMTNQELLIASLPIFIYSSTDHSEELECAVCFMDLKEGENVRLLPRCLHSFHAEYIDRWLVSHSTCPLCRSTVQAAAEDTSLLLV